MIGLRVQMSFLKQEFDILSTSGFMGGNPHKEIYREMCFFIIKNKLELINLWELFQKNRCWTIYQLYQFEGNRFRRFGDMGV